MSTIQFLNPETYEKIAAGEIIENPSSVIQELLDNAIDANANFIQLWVEKGGKTLIRIIDNGIGMSQEDLEICWLRYSTSKIKQFEDIYKHSFLGFRGEALHSISKVAKLVIQSKIADAKLGNQIKIDFGHFLNLENITMNQGTTVHVEKLFEKIPVRKMQLKSDAYEFKRIKNISIHKILAYKHIKFQLFHNKELILQVNNENNILNRIQNLFSKEDLPLNLLEINKTHSQLKIKLEAYISPILEYQKSKAWMHIYVNNKYLYYSPLYKAIIEAYAHLPIHQYPIAFLFISLPNHFLDINVHPSKKKMHILVEPEIHKWIVFSINESIKNHLNVPNIASYKSSTKNPALHKNNDIPMISNPLELKNSILEKISLNKEKAKDSDHSHHKSTNPLLLLSELLDNKDSNLKQENIFTKQDLNSSFLTETLLKEKNYTLIGSVFKTFFLIAYKNILLWIDQHAIHEILNYEKLKDKIKKMKKIESEYLIKPIEIYLAEFISGYLEDNELNLLKTLGFEVYQLNPNKIIVKSGPNFLNIEEIQSHFEKILLNLKKYNKIPNILEFLDKTIQSKACRSSIKSGDPISEEGLLQLIKELSKYPNYLACPHGRPIAIEMYQETIEKLFLRK